jgi:hypothetical protein
MGHLYIYIHQVFGKDQVINLYINKLFIAAY